MVNKWDIRFLELAEHISRWSKDPSTKCGAVIVDNDRRIVSVGYNGLPKGISKEDGYLDDKDLKYVVIIHAEHNALIFAKQSIEGYTLYTWPFSSCAHCTSMFIQAGIRRMVFPSMPERIKDRWGKDAKVADRLRAEAGIKESCV
jgi:dCMP deaminase